MNKEILQQILNTKAMPFTYEEIERLMYEELEKDPNEMDTELADPFLVAELRGMKGEYKTLTKKTEGTVSFSRYLNSVWYSIYYKKE